MLRFLIFLKYFVFSFIFLIPVYPAFAKYRDLKIEMTTKNIQGAKGFLSVVIQAPVEKTWVALNDFNDFSSIYPRILKSYCMPLKNVLLLKKESFANANTIVKKFPEKCNPQSNILKSENRYFIFQEIDYPFPLGNRWFAAEIQTKMVDSKNFRQEGHLKVGNQPFYNVVYDLKKNQTNINETLIHVNFHVDPGGFIPDWLIQKVSQKLFPLFISILEKQANL